MLTLPTLAVEDCEHLVRSLRKIAEGPKEHEPALLRLLAQNSLFYLATQVLGYKDIDPYFHWRMCAEWQQPGRHKLFLYPRGTFKTSILTIAGSIWLIINNPNIRILISNANLDNAKSILYEMRNHFLKNEAFRQLFPEFCPNEVKGEMREFGTQLEFTVPCRTLSKKESTVEVGSVEGNIVSRHYDVHIGDDLVNDKNTTTKDQIDKVESFRRATYALLDPGYSLDLLIGTIWHWDDTYCRIINDKNTPYQVFKREIMEKSPKGDMIPTFPSRFPMKEIKGIKRRMGSRMFMAQYMNCPMDEDDAPFKREWIHYYEEIPQDKSFFVCTCVDPAVSDAVSADYSGIVTIATTDDDAWYVLETVRRKMNPLQLIEELYAVNERWNPTYIGIEAFAFQKSLKFFIQEEMRRSGRYLPLKELSTESMRSKHARIMGLQPRLEYCKFHVKHDMDELVDELLRYPRAPHDDLIDALAYTLQFIRTPGKRLVPSQLTGTTFDGAMRTITHRQTEMRKIGMGKVRLYGEG